jgi:prophage antirepressor-like protein
VSSIQLFRFEGQEVRFVGTPDTPEWVARDVVAILYPEADPRNYSNYLSRIPDKWKGHKPIMTPGGSQEVVTVFEPGLYQLITRSNSLAAIPFQEWVFEEVLPTIRKRGSYFIGGPASKPAVQHYTDRIIALKTTLRVPDGYWCVIEECGHLLLEVERTGYPVDRYDLLDGSIGLRWSKYRQEQEWCTKAESAHYYHNHGWREIKAYPFAEMGYFKQWLKTVYTFTHLPRYLADKYGQAQLEGKEINLKAISAGVK